MAVNKLALPTIAIAVACVSATEKGPDKKHSKPAASKPNIIYILADDLGYGELGCYGQKKIETPNIDRLAANGIRFTQHYSGAPVCAPSRCALMTGLHSGHMQIRGNDEWGDRGPVWDYKAMIADSSLEGQRPLLAGTVTLGKLLQSAGYKTAVVGKWGLGAPHSDGAPNKQGFDFFFGFNCQRQAHTHYPVHLWKNDKKFPLYNDTIVPGTRLSQGADPLDLQSYRNFTLKNYAHDAMFDQITNFVKENRDHPFALFWTTTIPHAAIQAPQRWVDYYVKKFGDEKPYLGDKGYFPHRYPHAGYAAMISFLDEQVGKLITQLKELGIYDNTLIIFTSDNGPTYNGGTDSPWFNSAGPFRSDQGFGKGSVYEGGMRVPMIAVWPGKIKVGRTSDHISAFWDVLPTLCEVSGIQKPAETDGISFLPELLEKKQKEHDYLYWEFPESGGQQAIRMGKWKAVRENIQKGELKTKLFDLDTDIREMKDVSALHPELVRQMESIFVKEHVASVNSRFRMKALRDE
jgi:arylsulfatase A-like enzyme